MALTAEQTTAQNFKDFYDRIRPLLNAQHYHVDRSGQELKCGDYNIQGNPTIPVGLSQNTHLTLTARGGQHPANFTIKDGNIVIPEGMTVNIASNMVVNNNGSESETNSLFMIYDYKNSANIGYASAVYHGNGVARTGSYIYNYTAPSGGAEIGLKCTYNAVAARTVGGESGLTITEIGRIVDPIQYVSSGDNLEETPVGNIISYMGNNVPKHYLACDGHEYPIGSYPELEAHFIAEFGSVNYFGGDGTSNWAVPDLRGEFLRGTGTNSRANNGNGANVGEHQDSTQHAVLVGGYSGGNAKKVEVRGVPDGGGNMAAVNTDMLLPGSVLSGSKIVSTANTGTIGDLSSSANSRYTSRPTNTSVQYCIKYESTYHVIVPSHAYKVSVAASIDASTNSEVAATLNSSDIIGDISLVSGNYLVAPVDGWYSVGCNWTCHGSFDQDYYFEINGTGLSASKQIGLSNTLYLNKGDKVRIIKYNGAANEGYINFCLLTSNVHENIIAGGEVYSTTEQVIGTHIDGKPLYQITYKKDNVSNGATTVESSFITNKSVDRVINIEACRLGTNGYIDSFDADNNYVCINNGNIVINMAQTGVTWSWLITVKYTKTTDVANTYTYKNSLLLTRPDLWTENTEIDFGGGLYGYRATGNMPAIAANTNTVRVNLLASLSGTSTIINYGGSVHGYNSANKVVNVPVGQALPRQNEPLAVKAIAGLFVTGGAGMVLEINLGDLYTTTSNTYDIWFTYKK